MATYILLQLNLTLALLCGHGIALRQVKKHRHSHAAGHHHVVHSNFTLAAALALRPDAQDELGREASQIAMPPFPLEGVRAQPASPSAARQRGRRELANGSAPTISGAAAQVDMKVFAAPMTEAMPPPPDGSRDGLWRLGQAASGAALLIGFFLWSRHAPARLEPECGHAGEQVETGRRRALQVATCARGALYMSTATVILPESYDLMEALGYGAMASGWLIGAAFVFHALFSIGAKPMMHPWNQGRIRAVVLITSAVPMVLTALFALAAAPPAWLPWSNETRVAILFAARIGLGMQGAQSVLMRVMGQKITPFSEMALFCIWRASGNTLGIGIGPLISGLVGYVSGADSVWLRAALPMYAMSALWAALLVVFYVSVPEDLEPFVRTKEAIDAADLRPEAAKTAAMANLVTRLKLLQRHYVWLACGIYGITRAFIVAALETATSFVLEVEFGWDTRMAGIAVGMTFMLGVPFAVVLTAARQKFAERTFLVACVATAAAAAVLLFPAVGSAIGGNKVAWLVLLADSVIFPMQYLESGMLDGLAAAAAVPGSSFSQENYSIIDSVGQNTMARFLAAPIARHFLALGGREYYAWFQLFLSFLACAIVWCVLWIVQPTKLREACSTPAPIDDVREAIGGTPMLRSKLLPRLGFQHQELHVKMELLNPSGSLKDRSASSMVKRAEEQGRLTPFSGQTLVESTSGNFAKALAMQCAKRGYRCLLVVDQAGLFKAQVAEAYGAKLDLVVAPPGTSVGEQRRLRIQRVQEIVEKDPKIVNLNQYSNVDNEGGYLCSMAPEICEQQPDLDCVVLTCSTGGHLRGCARHIKERMPHVKVIAVEPPGSRIFTPGEAEAASPKGQRLIRDGTGLHFMPTFVEKCLEEGLIDEIYKIDDLDAVLATVAFSRIDGLLAGPSTGRAACAALCHLQSGGASRRIIIIGCDRLEPYKEQIDSLMAQHLGEDFSDDMLLEKLRSRVEVVAQGCMRGKGMVDPAQVLVEHRKSQRQQG